MGVSRPAGIKLLECRQGLDRNIGYRDVVVEQSLGPWRDVRKDPKGRSRYE